MLCSSSMCNSSRMAWMHWRWTTSGTFNRINKFPVPHNEFQANAAGLRRPSCQLPPPINQTLRIHWIWQLARAKMILNVVQQYFIAYLKQIIVVKWREIWKMLLLNTYKDQISLYLLTWVLLLLHLFADMWDELLGAYDLTVSLS